MGCSITTGGRSEASWPRGPVTTHVTGPANGSHRSRPGTSAAGTRSRKEEVMQLGMVGLGRMGANLVRRLMQDGHECVVYDVQPDAVRSLAGEGATGAETLADLVAKLEK